jgi:hypothetical protein
LEELRRALAGLGSDGLRRGGSGLWRNGTRERSEWKALGSGQRGEAVPGWLSLEGCVDGTGVLGVIGRRSGG